MGEFLTYFADLRRDAGRQLPVAALLVALGALLEGVGVLAILPFAAVITGTADTQLSRDLLGWMSQFGIASEWSRAIALVGAFLALLAIRGIVIWQRDTRLLSLGLGYVDRWRSKLFRAIGAADWPTVSALRRTDIEHAVTNDVARLSAGTDQLLRAGAAGAMVLVQLGIVALLSPLLLVLVGVLMGTALLFTLPLLRKANLLGKRITHSGRRIHGVLGDFMASQKLARLNNAEGDFLDRFDSAVSDVRGHQLAFQKSQITARLVFQFAAGMVVLTALLVGFFILQTPLSVLAVTMVVLARLVGPIQMIAQTGQAIANALPAYGALRELYADLLAAAESPAAKPAQPARIGGPARLSLTGASFTYQGQSQPVLHSVSLTIEPGEIIALSGKSGAGKTTLLDILSGLLLPGSGELKVDGILVDSEAAMRGWRAQLAYLPQDPFLFDAPLRENLVWSADNPSDEQLWHALELAGAADFVRSARDGLQTRSGERGQAFSGGERQRLCIARALLRNPRLMILDEATSALDARLENDILTRLSAMRDRFSILYVTHRRDALVHADRVLSLEEGRIVSQ